MKKIIVFNQQEQTVLVTYSLFGIVFYTVEVDRAAIIDGLAMPV